MDSDLVINVIKPDDTPVVPPADDDTPVVPPADEDIPVVPSTNANVPNTGLFTNNSMFSNFSSALFIIGLALVLIIIIRILLKKAASFKYYFEAAISITKSIFKKTDSFKIISFKKHFVGVLAALTFILSIGIIAIINNNNNDDTIATGTGALSISTTPVRLEVELGDKTSYASSTNTVTVKSPTANGYTLYAYVNNKNLYLDNNSEENNEHIIFGLETSNSPIALENNSWGIAKQAVDDLTSTSFYGLSLSSDSPTLIASKTSHTQANDKVEVQYAAKLIPDLIIDESGYGSYGGVVINYVVIANPAAYSISYEKNITGDVSGMPQSQSGVTYDESINISGDVPTVTNARFIGWCDKSTTIFQNKDVCSNGTVYNRDGAGTVNMTYTIDQTVPNNELTLNAMWERKISYEINYNGNATDGTLDQSTMPSSQVGSTYNETVSIASEVPSRTDHVFKGWCTEKVLDNENCSLDNTYNLNGDGITNMSYTLDKSTLNNRLNLYAVWEESLPDPTSYSISYDENTFAEDIDNFPDNESGTTYNDAVGISDKVPVLENARFLGWCDEETSDDDEYSWYKQVCYGNVYNPGGDGTTNMSYILDKSASENNLTLYAMWEFAVEYEVYYDDNTTDTATNMPKDNPQTGFTFGDTIDIYSGVPQRTGYIFKGWCAGHLSILDDTCHGTIYNPNGDGTNLSQYIDRYDQNTFNLHLFAMWEKFSNLTFKAGDNIETVIVADSSQNYKPFYATPGNDIVFSNPAEDTEYIITVVPEAGYKLGTWSRVTGFGELASTELLTTTYTADSIGETLTATGVSGSYDNMQNLSSCPAEGKNVTDIRDGKSYTVKKLVSSGVETCFMASNLRLDGGVSLNPTTSNVSANGFTTPTDEWTSASQDYLAKAIMTKSNNEYYYNWYAATANPFVATNYQTRDFTTSEEDANALGDICPAGWHIFGDDVESLRISNSGFRSLLLSNGMLTTSGFFLSGAQDHVGDVELWWSSIRDNDYNGYDLYFLGNDIGYDVGNKKYGLSVRCLNSGHIETIDQITNMQDFDKLTTEEKTKVINSMDKNTDYRLVDSRDGTVYTFAKIENEDGTYTKVWMRRNLRLDLGRYGDQLNSSNTNNATSNFIDKVKMNPPSSSSDWCSDSTTNPDSACINKVAYDKSYIGDNTTDSYGTKYDEYGIYYNWYTAAAGNGTYGDICPAGWHLPTGGSDSGDFYDLNYYINNNSSSSADDLFNSPVKFTHSGFRHPYSIFAQGVYSRYWSSTADSLYNAYELWINPTSSTVINQMAIYKYFGLTIRCMLND